MLVARICADCLDDKVNDGSSKTWKALHKPDAIANARRCAPTSRSWAREHRVLRVVKAEQTRQETKRLRKSAKKISREAEASALRKAAAELALTNLVVEQAAPTEEIGQLGKRVNVAYRNAERRLWGNHQAARYPARCGAGAPGPDQTRREFQGEPDKPFHPPPGISRQGSRRGLG